MSVKQSLVIASLLILMVPLTSLFISQSASANIVSESEDTLEEGQKALRVLQEELIKAGDNIDLIREAIEKFLNMGFSEQLSNSIRNDLNYVMQDNIQNAASLGICIAQHYEINSGSIFKQKFLNGLKNWIFGSYDNSPIICTTSNLLNTIHYCDTDQTVESTDILGFNFPVPEQIEVYYEWHSDKGESIEGSLTSINEKHLNLNLSKSFPFDSPPSIVRFRLNEKRDSTIKIARSKTCPPRVIIENRYSHACCSPTSTAYKEAMYEHGKISRITHFRGSSYELGRIEISYTGTQTTTKSVGHPASDFKSENQTQSFDLNPTEYIIGVEWAMAENGSSYIRTMRYVIHDVVSNKTRITGFFPEIKGARSRHVAITDEGYVVQGLYIGLAGELDGVSVISQRAALTQQQLNELTTAQNKVRTKFLQQGQSHPFVEEREMVEARDRTGLCIQMLYNSSGCN